MRERDVELAFLSPPDDLYKWRPGIAGEKGSEPVVGGVMMDEDGAGLS